MDDLSGLVSTDSRKPIERLRRVQLYAIADERGITYPHDAPKTAMLPLLEAAGVDPAVPYNGADIQWQNVPVKDELGNVHIEIYPAQKEPDVPSQILDVVAATAKIAEQHEEPVKPAFSFPLDKMLPWQLNHMCKDVGVDASKTPDESQAEWKARMIGILENG